MTGMYRSVKAVSRALIVLTLSLSVLAAGSLPLPPPEVTSSISSRDLKSHVSFLASDEMGGRYALGPSIRIAARYLASRLESYGYKAGARGSFLQRIPLKYRSFDPYGSKVRISSGATKNEFRYAEDFLPDYTGEVSFEGQLVFMGYGEPMTNGLDVKNKIAIILSEGGAEGKALEAGAAGVIRVPPAGVLRAWAIGASAALTSSVVIARGEEEVSSTVIRRTITAGPKLTRWIASALGKDTDYLTSPDGKPRPAQPLDATAQVRVKVAIKDAPPAHNVIGLLEGSDPRLKQEYVVFSAHYDHVGDQRDGAIYNGADDDGSGVAAVLEIAEAFAVGPRPKRSIMIVFHTAEEIGLLGSQFNTDHEPAVPISKLVADFNIDMIGRSRSPGDNDPENAALSDRNTVYVIGAKRLSSELNRISEQTNAETTRLRLDHSLDNDSHPERLYYRSDHYNYAKHGIPVIFYFTGLHRDYHQPTDDIEKLDFEKMERIARLIFSTGWRVANLDHRLAVDRLKK
jgi:hypothetical protein